MTSASVNTLMRASRLSFPGHTDVVIVPPKRVRDYSPMNYVYAIQNKVSCVVNLTQEIDGADDPSNFYYRLKPFQKITGIESAIDACMFVFHARRNSARSSLNADVYRVAQYGAERSLRALTFFNVTNLKENGVISPAGTTPFTSNDLTRLYIFAKIVIEYADEYNAQFRHRGRNRLPILVHCNEGIVRTSLFTLMLFLVYYAKDMRPQRLPLFVKDVNDPTMRTRVRLVNGSPAEAAVWGTDRRRVPTEVMVRVIEWIRHPPTQDVVVRVSRENYSDNCVESLMTKFIGTYTQLCNTVKKQVDGKCARRRYLGLMRERFTMYVDVMVPLRTGATRSMYLQKNLYSDCQNADLLMYRSTTDENSDVRSAFAMSEDVSCQEVTNMLRRYSTRAQTPRSTASFGKLFIYLFSEYDVDWGRVYAGRVRMTPMVCCGSQVVQQTDMSAQSGTSQSGNSSSSSDTDVQTPRNMNVLYTNAMTNLRDLQMRVLNYRLIMTERFNGVPPDTDSASLRDQLTTELPTRPLLATQCGSKMPIQYIDSITKLDTFLQRFPVQQKQLIEFFPTQSMVSYGADMALRALEDITSKTRGSEKPIITESRDAQNHRQFLLDCGRNVMVNYMIWDVYYTKQRRIVPAVFISLNTVDLGRNTFSVNIYYAPNTSIQ